MTSALYLGKQVSGYNIVQSVETDSLDIVLAKAGKPDKVDKPYATARMRQRATMWQNPHFFATESDARDDLDKRVRRGF
jgi:hypothetical protein